MARKRFQSLAAAAQDPEIPFTQRQLRALAATVRPRMDTRGNVVDPGDPELAACFTQVFGPRSPLLLDVPQFIAVLERRSLRNLRNPEAA